MSVGFDSIKKSLTVTIGTVLMLFGAIQKMMDEGKFRQLRGFTSPSSGQTVTPLNQSPSNGVSSQSNRSSQDASRSSIRSDSEPKGSDQNKDVLGRIIQVANVSPEATKVQLEILFEHFGRIIQVELYPSVNLGEVPLQSKVGFIKYRSPSSALSAMHLTNTVFIDRALIVIPYLCEDDTIPDELQALVLLSNGVLVPGVVDPKLPQHVVSQLEGIPPHQKVVTIDPHLEERNLPPYPPLPVTLALDARKIEEIRRTVVVINLSPKLSAEDVMDYFTQAGEIKYFRFCSRDNDPLKYALIEFTLQPSILNALEYNGCFLGGQVIRYHWISWRGKVYHSTQAIIKPQPKTNESAKREIDNALSMLEQNVLGSDASELLAVPKKKKKKRSRSSRSRSRSWTHRSRRGRSRSRGRRRARFRSASKVRRSPRRHSRHHRRSKKERRGRSRSRSRRALRSRSRRRSRSRSRCRRRRRSRSSSSNGGSRGREGRVRRSRMRDGDFFREDERNKYISRMDDDRENDDPKRERRSAKERKARSCSYAGLLEAFISSSSDHYKRRGKDKVDCDGQATREKNRDKNSSADLDVEKVTLELSGSSLEDREVSSSGRIYDSNVGSSDTELQSSSSTSQTHEPMVD